MIRTPHEPDNGLFLPLGHPEPKGAPKPAVAPPFTVYTPIKGRPGWEDDGYRHLRYDATADAAKHERAVEVQKAKNAAKAEEQCCGWPGNGCACETARADTLAPTKAQEELECWTGHPNCRCITDVVMDARHDDRADAMLYAYVEKNINISVPQKINGRLVDMTKPAEMPVPIRQRAYFDTRKPAAVILIGHDRLAGGLHVFRFNDGPTTGTHPIDGCDVSVLEGDTRGNGPLVECAEKFTGSEHALDLKRYLSGLRNCLPADVPLYWRRHGNKGAPLLWTRTDVPPF